MLQPELLIYDTFELSWAMRIPERIIYDTFGPTLYRNALLSTFFAQFIPERIMNQTKCIPERIICDVFRRTHVWAVWLRERIIYVVFGKVFTEEPYERRHFVQNV